MESPNNLLARVLSLSYRISCSSPPMKPFIRFSAGTNDLYRTASLEKRSLFWDFDDTLQRILLNIVKAISTPDQLVQACVDRWKSNLGRLYEKSQKEFDEVVKNKSPYHHKDTARIEFLTERLDQDSRFLYIGCGRGTECLSLANRGLKVVGIDTNFLLTRTANDWSNYLALPFQAICMDVMELGFHEESFDSFIIEFYGHLPSLYQTFLIQKNLARVLRQGGRGFVVGVRKHYASFWFLMREAYPVSMVKWLADQAGLDYRWNNSDGHEEKLLYGLYYRSHTVESLSRELGYAFKVKECLYEKTDPRYVIGIVEPKGNLASLPEPEANGAWGGTVSSCPETWAASVPVILEQVEAIGSFLESHENNVSRYFEAGSPEAQGPFRGIPVDMPAFLRLLEAAFRSLPEFN